MITVVILLNIVATIIFFVLNVKTSHKASICILFISLPVLGFVLYFIMQIIIIWRGSKKEYDRFSLVNRLHIKKEILHPDIKKELDVISVEDAMAISNNSEKRSLLLSQLKNNMDVNYRSILGASNDSDTESAHYVASAKTAVYDKIYGVYQQASMVVEEEPDNISALVLVLEAIIELLDSQLIARSEQNIYRRRYCDKFELLNKLKQDNLTEKHYEYYLKSLVALEKFDEANTLWNNYKTEFKNEAVFMELLNMHYVACDKDEFYAIINEICESNINLSYDGLSRLRFWLNERDKYVIN